MKAAQWISKPSTKKFKHTLEFKSPWVISGKGDAMLWQYILECFLDDVNGCKSGTKIVTNDVVSS